MKVLLLHQFYNTPASGGAIRSYYLAQALIKKGIQVVVITTHNQSEIKITTTEGVEIHYLPIDYNNRFGFFKRVYSFWLFVWHIVKYTEVSDADVVYAFSPVTTGLAAMWIKLRYKILTILKWAIYGRSTRADGFIKPDAEIHSLQTGEEHLQ